MHLQQAYTRGLLLVHIMVTWHCCSVAMHSTTTVDTVPRMSMNSTHWMLIKAEANCKGQIETKLGQNAQPDTQPHQKVGDFTL